LQTYPAHDNFCALIQQLKEMNAFDAVVEECIEEAVVDPNPDEHLSSEPDEGEDVTGEADVTVPHKHVQASQTVCDLDKLYVILLSVRLTRD
jgi:hypothetical protein